MKIGDYLVIAVSAILSILGVLDVIDAEGFEGFAYTFGMFLGGFIMWALILFILLFAVRYVREHILHI